MPDIRLAELSERVFAICQKPYGAATTIDMELVQEFVALPLDLKLETVVSISSDRDLWLRGLKKLTAA